MLLTEHFSVFSARTRWNVLEYAWEKIKDVLARLCVKSGVCERSL